MLSFILLASPCLLRLLDRVRPQALLIMAVGGGDLLALGGGGIGGARVTTLLLLAGLASLPVVLQYLEER